MSLKVAVGWCPVAVALHSEPLCAQEPCVQQYFRGRGGREGPVRPPTGVFLPTRDLLCAGCGLLLRLLLLLLFVDVDGAIAMEVLRVFGLYVDRVWAWAGGVLVISCAIMICSCCTLSARLLIGDCGRLWLYAG